MTEQETLALLEVKTSDSPEKSSPQALVPNGRQPEGEGGAKSPGAESLGVGSSAGSPTDGLDSTVSEAATLPWGPALSPVLPPESEPLTKLEELPEDDANLLPEKAARAFVPIDLQCIERRPQEDLIMRCEAGEGECRTFMPRRATQPDPTERKWAEAVVRPPGRSYREWLRAVASVGAALILFPCLLYGAYAFLPFDVPRLPTMSSRLIYTLRCGVFATFPIVLGILVYGLSLLCFSALRPFGEPRREVEIHRRYVAQSIQLFILYFFNLAVLSTYLPQDTLKLLPLLTGLFAISRLIYWLTFAVGRSFRGFGYGRGRHDVSARRDAHVTATESRLWTTRPRPVGLPLQAPPAG
uniref:Transmembrane protein 79 n=1 Tax=Rhinopithecus bieti TaxID=61621 RepID=A0A2K6L141_RHIBE